MRIPFGRWSLASLPLLAFILAAWALENVLGVEGNVRWILRIGFWVLGLAASFVMHRFLKARQKPEKEPSRGREDEVDAAITEAESRLDRAASVPADRISKLPVTLLLGPRDSTKTTVAVHSGLDPELLAGEVWRGETVVPTDGVNIWYGEGSVLVEAGGALLDDDSRWDRLLRKLRPRRLDAVLGTKDQPHRAAVVCFGCDEFVKPGASEGVPAAARELRERLQEAARRLGARIPVYVLFTKADRIPYFEDYVRNFTRSEVEEVLGATIPLARWSGRKSYGETATSLLNEAFDQVFRSLARNRPEQLRREGDPDARRGIYEFPRELNRISETATRFLVELCRPSHLQVSPVLRGFYFTGVRPIVVEASDPAVQSGGDPTSESGSMGATMVFDASQMREPSHSPAPSSSTRRIPEWTFLQRLFRRVVLGDRTAASMTGGGAAVNFLRRVLGGGAAAALVLLTVALTISAVSNQRLTSRVESALQEAEVLADASIASPGLDELEDLDALGSEVATLRSYEEAHPPLRARWGLYRGTDLLEPARRVYMRLFERLLGQEARQALARHLQDLPPEPDESSDYSATYDALKAYLVTTSYPQNSVGAFLAPVLMEHWAKGRSLEREAVELARRQFEIYGEELRHGRPTTVSADPELVNRSRDFLNRFANVERYYRSMISRASSENAGIELTERFPTARGVLTSDAVVPGAFTLEGWRFIQDRLNDVEELFSREEWVTGGQSFTEAELERLEGELRGRYVEDYQRHWREMLASTSVVAFREPADAAQKLRSLSDNRSPLLQLLTAVDRNTRVGVPEVDAAFQPVRLLTPPDTVDRYVVDTNQPYVDALADLQGSLEQLEQNGDGAIPQVAGDADRLRNVVREVAREFSIDGEAERVGASLRRLLESPADLSQRLAAQLPAREVNARGAAFCRRFQSLTAAYPFDLRSSGDTEIGDVDAALKPAESALWSFYEDTLREILSRQGTRYEPRVGATPRPGSEFLRFFNRAAAVSDALYSPDGSGPAVDFILRLEASADVPEVTVSVDGQTQTFTRTSAAGQPFRWEGARARSARITGLVDGAETVLLEPPTGAWALFRLLQDARWEDRGDGRYSLTWPIPGRQSDLGGQLILNVEIPILNPEFLAEMTCVPTVTR